MISPVFSITQGFSDLNIMKISPCNDIVDQMPVLRLEMHPWYLVASAQVKECVYNQQAMRLIYPSTNCWNQCSNSSIILKSHCLVLAIVKETSDENGFKHSQKITNCTPPNFKVGNRVFFKDKQPGKWDLKWRTGYRIVCIECNGH